MKEQDIINLGFTKLNHLGADCFTMMLNESQTIEVQFYRNSDEYSVILNCSEENCDENIDLSSFNTTTYLRNITDIGKLSLLVSLLKY